MIVEEETPSGWQTLQQYTSDFFTAMPAVAKVSAMGADRIFYATRFSAWVYGVNDGLSTPFGVGLATAFATCAIVDNWWGRGYSMIRRERARLAAPVFNPQGPRWLNSGRNNVSFAKAGGYVFIQLCSIQYMINSIPGSNLGALSITKLMARLGGSTFNAFCDPAKGDGPASSKFGITLAHLAGAYLAYSTISSFLSYNTPQIRNYFNKLFIDEEIWDIKAKSWFTTLTGTFVNTLGIAFAGIAALDLLEYETLCHAGLEDIPYWLKVGWVIQSCVINVIINGLMTLYAVHMHDSNEHHKARHSLANEIEMSLEWGVIISLAIFGNSVAALCATEVQVPNLPGSFNRDYKYLAYNSLIILGALPLSAIAFKNQLALSSESDVRERVTRKEEKDAATFNTTQRTAAVHRAAQHQFVEADEQKENLYNFDTPRAHYGSNGHMNGNGHFPANLPVVRKSFCARLNFFQQAIPPAELSEHERLLGELQAGMTRYDSEPEESKMWGGCGIM
jgi:hypothetical protein